MCVGVATKVKTLRLPEDVIETIEQFPGENFTDKFIAAVRLLGRDREKLVKQLDDLEHDRQQKLARIAENRNAASERRNQCQNRNLIDQTGDLGSRNLASAQLTRITCRHHAEGLLAR